MKLLMAFFLSIFFVACSHHHKEPKHHHHQFEKKCAYEVGLNHFNVEGKEELKLEHGNETYYFSTPEKKQKFQKDLEKNIQKSKMNWMKRASPALIR